MYTLKEKHEQSDFFHAKETLVHNFTTKLLLGDFFCHMDVHTSFISHSWNRLTRRVDILGTFTPGICILSIFYSTPMLLNSIKSPLGSLIYNSNVSPDYILYCGPGEKIARKPRNSFVFSKFWCVGRTLLFTTVGRRRSGGGQLSFGAASNRHCSLCHLPCGPVLGNTAGLMWNGEPNHGQAIY